MTHYAQKIRYHVETKLGVKLPSDLHWDIICNVREAEKRASKEATSIQNCLLLRAYRFQELKTYAMQRGDDKLLGLIDTLESGDTILRRE